MSKEKDEMKVAGIIAAGVGLVLVLVVLFNGCGDGSDLRKLDAAPAAPVTGCDLPDAGPEAQPGECFINPLAGTIDCP